MLKNSNRAYHNCKMQARLMFDCLAVGNCVYARPTGVKLVSTMLINK